MANIWISLRSTLASAGRFLQLMERKPEIVPNLGVQLHECHGDLDVRRISFAYPSARQTPVLAEVSFHAVAGSIVALVGESGAGKSTLGQCTASVLVYQSA